MFLCVVFYRSINILFAFIVIISLDLSSFVLFYFCVLGILTIKFLSLFVFKLWLSFLYVSHLSVHSFFVCFICLYVHFCCLSYCALLLCFIGLFVHCLFVLFIFLFIVCLFYSSFFPLFVCFFHLFVHCLFVLFIFLSIVCLFFSSFCSLFVCFIHLSVRCWFILFVFLINCLSGRFVSNNFYCLCVVESNNKMQKVLFQIQKFFGDSKMDAQRRG